MQQIKVLDVGQLTSVQGPKAVYKMFELAYSVDGKPASKKINQYSDVFKALQNAKTGSYYEIDDVKNDKGYWDWKKATLLDGAPAEAPAAASTEKPKAGYKGNTYETPEERALRRAFEEKKQVLIVAQSSLANALAYKPGASMEEVLQVADTFAAWVNSKVAFVSDSLEEDVIQ